MASDSTSANVSAAVSQTTGSGSSKTSSPSGDQKQQPANDNKTHIPRSVELQLLVGMGKNVAHIRTTRPFMMLQLFRLFRVKDGVLEARTWDPMGDVTGNWRPFDEYNDADWLQRWAVERLAYVTEINAKAEMHRKNHQLAGFVELKRAARVASKNVSPDVSGVAELF
jgi:hypothetical protein